jgi:hypothetical protein
MSGLPSSFQRCGGGERAPHGSSLQQLEPCLFPHNRSRWTVACGIAICLSSNSYLHYAVGNISGCCLGGCPSESGTDAVHLQGGQDLSPTTLEAANSEVVWQWMDRAARAEAVATYGLSAARQAATRLLAPCFGRSKLDCKMALLEKWQAVQNMALQQG